MFVQSHPDTANVPKKVDEELIEGNYFIVDWVGADPIHRGVRRPIVIAGNCTEEDLKNIADGKIKLETPRFGTAQRAVLKVVKVEKI